MEYDRHHDAEFRYGLGEIMAMLNDRQIKILRVIDEGNITGEDIVEALGSSVQMTSYYLNTLADDGYLKVARLYDNETRDFIVVRAYLTDQGKLALENAGIKSSHAEVIIPQAVVSTEVPTESPSHQTTNQIANQTIDQPIDYARIAQSIAQLNHEIIDLPEARRELVEVYLEDLQNEANIAYRRKLVRLKAYFLAIVNILSPVLKQGNEALRQPIEVIATQLQISIQLPEKSI